MTVRRRNVVIEQCVFIATLFFASTNLFAWGQCGAYGSSISRHIPDGEKITDGRYGEKYVRWGSVCAKHDLCYAEIAPKFKHDPKSSYSNKARKICDKRFKKDFDENCSKQLKSRAGLLECFRNGTHYYQAIRVGGKSAWINSMR